MVIRLVIDGGKLSSRGAEQFEDKVMSAMRHEFGGHVEKPSATGVGT